MKINQTLNPKCLKYRLWNTICFSGLKLIIDTFQPGTEKPFLSYWWRLRCRCEVEGEEAQGSQPGGAALAPLCCFWWNKMRQCAGREVRQPGREGASPGGFKLLSVNVTRCYLDSNYTCQLSLSPHLSLSPRLSVCLSASLNPRTLYFSVLNKTMRSFFFFLYSSVTSLRVSQYYRRLDSLPHSHSVFTAALILFLLDYLTHRGCRS